MMKYALVATNIRSKELSTLTFNLFSRLTKFGSLVLLTLIDAFEQLFKNIFKRQYYDQSLMTLIINYI